MIGYDRLALSTWHRPEVLHSLTDESCTDKSFMHLLEPSCCNALNSTTIDSAAAQAKITGNPL